MRGGGLPSEVVLPLAVLVLAAFSATLFPSRGHSRRQPPPTVALADAEGAAGAWELSWDGWTVRVQRDPNDGSTNYDHVAVTVPRESLIRRIAAEEGIDWKLLAAVAATGREVSGEANDHDAAAPWPMWIPDAAVQEAGASCCRGDAERLRISARHLRRLLDRFSPASPEDRVPLALAAYRMGLDHLEDAQILAREFDFDPFRWRGSMEGMIGLLEVPAFAQRVPNGFADGAETRRYVSVVIAHYRALQERHAP